MVTHLFEGNQETAIQANDMLVTISNAMGQLRGRQESVQSRGKNMRGSGLQGKIDLDAPDAAMWGFAKSRIRDLPRSMGISELLGMRPIHARAISKLGRSERANIPTGEKAGSLVQYDRK